MSDSERPTTGGPPSADSLAVLSDPFRFGGELSQDDPHHPDNVLREARTDARVHLGLAVISAFALLLFGWLQREDLLYGLRGGEPLELGDFDQLLRAGSPVDGAFEHNRYARYDRGLVTAYTRSDDAAGWSAFFDPVANMIVVTRRAIPTLISKHVFVASAYDGLLREGWLRPDDLGVAFSAEGRLVLADAAPRRFRAVRDELRARLRLDARRPERPVWLFIDGARPKEQRVLLVLFGVAILPVLVAFLLARRSRERVALLEDALRES
jgi:hypothetical protein